MKLKRFYALSLCTLLMGIYWMGSAFILTFASVFLLDRGLNNTETGIVLASGSVLSILLQSVPASWADTYDKISINKILMAFLFSELIFISFLLAQPELSKPLLIIAYTLLVAFDMAFYSFINSLIMEYENSGEKLNFGFIRSFGSATYGVSTLLLGLIISSFGLRYMLPILLALRVITLLFVLLLKNPRKLRTIPSKSGAAANSYIQFFREHPHMFVLMFGFFFLWVSGTSTNNYLIHIVRRSGGSTTTMGIIGGIGSWIEIPFMLLCTCLIRKKGSSFALRLSAFFYIMKPLIMLMARTPLIVGIGQLMQGPSYAIFAIACVYYVNESVPAKDTVKAQAVVGIFTKGLSGITANLVSGMILDFFGVTAMLIFCICCTCFGFLIITYVSLSARYCTT